MRSILSLIALQWLTGCCCCCWQVHGFVVVGVPAVSVPTEPRGCGLLGLGAPDEDSAAPAVEVPPAAAAESVAPIAAEKSPAADRFEALDAALRYNSTAALEIVETIQELQRSASPADAESFVASLLDEVDQKTPWWTRFRPLARISRRTRRACLRRVLDLSTPAVSETESVGIDGDADRRRRRRSLVVVLRSLANLYDENDEADDNEAAMELKSATRRGPPAIVALEKAARRDAKAASVGADDMAKRLPKGLETPRYTVIAERSAYEVRRYEPFSVCSVAMNKPRPANAEETDAKISNPQLSGASSFGALAGYLFGKNEQKTAMKMTTPVLSTGDFDSRQMSFVLPSDYWNGLDAAPKPLEGSGIVLQQDEGGERAVVMFGGFAGKKDVEEQTKKLLNGLSKDKKFRADPHATVSLAQYNDPFTPPWKRRNEVSIKVLPVESK